MTKFTLYLITVFPVALVLACDAEEQRSEGLVVRTAIEGAEVESLVFRDGELVAASTIEDGRLSVSSIQSGQELVSELTPAIDPRHDLEAYESLVLTTAEGLEQVDTSSDFRTLDECGYIPWYSTTAGFCALSWCGSSCWALDCSMGIHFITGCGT